MFAAKAHGQGTICHIIERIVVSVRLNLPSKVTLPVMTAALSEDRFKYGMPLLCAEWPSRKYFLVGGGGGTASTGIKNRVLVAKFEDGVVSDQLTELSCDSQTPVRSCSHPNGQDIVIGLANEGVKHLRLHTLKSAPSLEAIPGSPVLDAFEGVHEEVVCLVFSCDGRFLIGGFSGGWIQIWQWPEMNIHLKFREDALYSTLKDLDVRSDDVPAFVALTTSKGTAELWDFNEGTMLYEFPRHGSKGVRFVHCKFLPETPLHLLYTTLVTRRGSFLIKWRILKSGTVKLLRKVKVGNDPLSAFAVRPRVMVTGSSEGDLTILTTDRMLPMQTIQGAHMVFVTAVAFAPTSDNKNPAEVLSVSGDASAKVTVIQYKRESGLWLKSMVPYIMMNVLLVIFAVYLLWISDIWLNTGGADSSAEL